MEKADLFLTKWPFLLKLRLFFCLIALGLVGLFLFLRIVPSGRISYQRDWPAGLRSGKGFISDFKPGERLSDGEAALKITGDPVYFSLFTPRGFDKAVVTVKYRDHLASDTPIIETGVLKDRLTGGYELRPLENRLLDNLGSAWTALADQGIVLYQAARSYDSIDGFRRDLAAGKLAACERPADCVATYNYDLPFDYQPLGTAPRPFVIDQPLRGAHQFYVWLAKGPWRFKFDFVDLNQDRAADPITVNVRAGAALVASESLADENKAPESGRTEEKILVLAGDSAAANLYKVEVNIGNDMVIARIESPSDQLSFINHLWPVSGSGHLDLYSDAGYLAAHTSNPASLGSLTFGEKSYTVDKTDRQFVFQAGPGIKKIGIGKNDLILENNGVFAFSREGVIDPAYRRVDPYFSLAGSGVKYILADYREPEIKDGVKTATTSLSLVGADRNQKKYTFLISIPGLNGTAGASEYLDIAEIKVDLAGKTLWQKLRSLF